MKTYILKRDVWNDILFPMGTIVTPCEGVMVCFEVVEGNLIGKKGGIADGLFKHDFACDDTPINRELIADIIQTEKDLKLALQKNDRRIHSILSVTH